MLRKIRKGQSLIEYIALFSTVLVAFLFFQKYIVQGFSGRWKNVGDSLGHGMIYDPKKTTVCSFDFVYLNVWFDEKCYNSSAQCDKCIFAPTDAAKQAECPPCISACRSAICDG